MTCFCSGGSVFRASARGVGVDVGGGQRRDVFGGGRVDAFGQRLHRSPLARAQHVDRAVADHRQHPGMGRAARRGRTGGRSATRTERLLARPLLHRPGRPGCDRPGRSPGGGVRRRGPRGPRAVGRRALARGVCVTRLTTTTAMIGALVGASTRSALLGDGHGGAVGQLRQRYRGVAARHRAGGDRLAVRRDDPGLVDVARGGFWTPFMSSSVAPERRTLTTALPPRCRSARSWRRPGSDRSTRPR